MSPILLFRSLDHLVDGARIYDRMLRLVYANSAAEKLLQAGADPAADTFLRQVFQDKQNVVGQHTVVSDDGVERVYETVYSPVPGESGHTQFVIGITRDLSEVRRLRTA